MKLSVEENTELKSMVESGEYTDDQLREKFGISERSLKFKKLNWGIPSGITEKSPEITLEEPLKEEPVAVIEEPLEDEGLNKNELLGISEDIESKMDPKKDYCRNCYETGVITEVSKDYTRCPRCGVLLKWEE